MHVSQSLKVFCYTSIFKMWHPWNFFCVVNGDFLMILIISKIQTICLIMKNIDSVSEKQTNNNKKHQKQLEVQV